MTDKASIIEAICNAIASGDDSALAAAVKEYPFVPQTNARRHYTAVEATRIFVRDGFVDRYSGARLIHPAVLRLLSKFLPREFPFHPNWKMSETHPAYWELVPTVDHIVPVARGGADSEENWVTTSMLRKCREGKLDSWRAWLDLAASRGFLGMGWAYRMAGLLCQGTWRRRTGSLCSALVSSRTYSLRSHPALDTDAAQSGVR